MSFHICVIGCGSIATGYHGPSYTRYVALHPNVVLSACCDVDAGKAAAFRARFGFINSYTDYQEMLRTESPDAVCLAVPPPLTCQIGCDILALGYPLLMEKPPGLTVTEIDRLIMTAAASGAPNQVAFNRRYTPLVRRLKTLLTAGDAEIGIQHLRYDFTRIGRTDADFSTTAIHGIDTARFIAGCDYAHLEFRYQPLLDQGATVANVYLDGVMTSGATVHLEFCPVAGAVTERASLYAQDHTFYLNLPIWNGFDAPGRLQHLHTGVLVHDETGPQVTGSADDFVLNGFYAENAAFFDDIQAGRRPSGDVSTARQSVEIMQCIRERRIEYTLAPRG